MPHERILDGRYEVRGLIGRGGMADVFEGRDRRLNRKVAIKMMRPDLARDPQFRSRFQREAWSSAALNHPNIVSVYDTGEEKYQDGAHHRVSCPYMVMEFVSGRTLRELLHRGEIPVEQAAEWTSGVLAALDHSHGHEGGIVHRDIKPANVMVTAFGAVKVMDFGIARAQADADATMTQSQSMMGTAQYLSPEQARGETVDSRSDLYSAGCLLFELLTGRPPFVGDTPVALAYQHAREKPPAASTLNPSVAPALDAVVACALAKDPDERFQSGQLFRSALDHAVRDPLDVSAALAAGAVGVASATEAGARAAVDPAPTEAIDVIGPTGPGGDTAPNDGAPARAMGAAGAAGLVGTTPPEPSEDHDHPLAFAGEPPDGAAPRRRRRHRVWIPVLVVVVALTAIAGGWFLMNELNRRNLEASLVTVPSVEQMTQREAQNALTGAELRPIVEEVHDDEVPRDLAVGTEPRSGATVQRNQEITLFISQGPEQVELPEDLVGHSEATARDTLEALGLSISSVRYVPSSDTARDRLVGTSPALGSTVPAGSSVELRMSSGMVAVPDVEGLTQGQASAALEEAGLSIFVTEVASDAPAGSVVSQDPAAGTEIAQGSRVAVQVARPPSTPSAAPTGSSPAPSDEPSGESPSPSPTPSESDTSTPSATPSDSPSPEPSDTASPTPTQTIEPTETAEPTEPGEP